MDRTACVNLPAFPLQLLVRRHPDWKDHPVTVVDKDTPQGTILWVNKSALRFRILPGMRYAKALSIVPELHAGVVSDSDIEAHIAELTTALRSFTPDVEPCAKEPGVFWLSASGLTPLFPTLRQWAGLIGAELSQLGLYWTVAVGFTRYGTYASARAGRAGAAEEPVPGAETRRAQNVIVFENPEDERHYIRALSPLRIGFEPELRDALTQLGITTLGAFLDLPENSIRKRFDDAAYDLYKLARGELYTPIDPTPPEERFIADGSFDQPQVTVERLMATLRKLLNSILVSLDVKNRLLASLTLWLVLDDGDEREEHLKPACPTVDAKQITKLIELRLQNISLESGVVDITIEAEDVPSAYKQLDLFSVKSRRDLGAADRTFARLRAELGEHAVMRARLREGHLPEASFEWEPMEKLSAPVPRKVTVRSLVRRIFSRSIGILFGSPPSGGSLGGAFEGALGPYIVSGGWWLRRVHREYYFIHHNGGWLWIYYDRRRKRSFVQGTVE